jgi:DNA-binding NarL/FixJ family response regulator
MPISVLLADDTSIVRKAIRELLNSSPAIKVVGEAASFQETLKLIEALKPNVVVMDLHMPGEVAVTPTELKDRLDLGASSLLAISIWSDDESHTLAESYGASRLLDKIEISGTLVQAIVDLAPIGMEPQLARSASA